MTLPTINDIHNVHFGKLPDVISGRSISTTLGFQNLKAYFSDPDKYNVERPNNIHDVYLGH